MDNFEGGIVEDKRKTNDEIYIRDDNNMFKNCSVSIKKLDENINSTISSAYVYDPVSLQKQ